MAKFLKDKLADLDNLDEDDKLMLKSIQIKVLYNYKLWQIPYIGFGGLYIVNNLFNGKKSLPARMIIACTLGTFLLWSQHYVGQYGLLRNIEPLFSIMLQEKHIQRRSRVSLEAMAEFEI